MSWKKRVRLDTVFPVISIPCALLFCASRTTVTVINEECKSLQQRDLVQERLIFIFHIFQKNMHLVCRIQFPQNVCRAEQRRQKSYENKGRKIHILKRKCTN